VYEAQIENGTSINRFAYRELSDCYSAAIAENAPPFYELGNALIRLKHPNILPVHSFGINMKAPGGDKFGLVMDFVSGMDFDVELRMRPKSLADYAKKRDGQIPERDLAPLVQQVLSGAAFAHSIGVVHDHLKPSNVMLENAPNGMLVKLSDFGLAGLVVAPRGPKLDLGDARNDVYAVGLMCFKLLTGTNFQAGGFAVKIAQVKPSVWRDFLVKSLHPNAAERYADCGVMLNAFGSVQEDLAMRKARSTKLELRRTQSRVAKVLAEKSKMTTATKDRPWTNSMGMKFVPVPGTNVLFSVWQTRVQDYKKFVKATKREWPKPEFHQGGNHPAVMVSAKDAWAFCRWLTDFERRSGYINGAMRYSLPSNSEWSVAVGVTTSSQLYPWGGWWPPPKNVGNYSQKLGVDDYEFTSPVGSFPSNKLGLYDMGGNVWEYCAETTDRGNVRAWCKVAVARGAAWSSDGDMALRSDYATDFNEDFGLNCNGFRCVLVGSSTSRDQTVS